MYLFHQAVVQQTIITSGGMKKGEIKSQKYTVQKLCKHVHKSNNHEQM